MTRTLIPLLAVLLAALLARPAAADVLEFICPDDIIVNSEPGRCSAAVTFPDPILRPHPEGVTIECFPRSGSRFGAVTFEPLNRTEVICTALDQERNVLATCSFFVTVR